MIQFYAFFLNFPSIDYSHQQSEATFLVAFVDCFQCLSHLCKKDTFTNYYFTQTNLEVALRVQLFSI